MGRESEVREQGSESKESREWEGIPSHLTGIYDGESGIWEGFGHFMSRSERVSRRCVIGHWTMDTEHFESPRVEGGLKGVSSCSNANGEDGSRKDGENNSDPDHTSYSWAS